MDEQEFKEVKILIGQIEQTLKIALKETKDIPRFRNRLHELTTNTTQEQLNYIYDKEKILQDLVKKIDGTILGGE
jgi:hypothetical protein